MEGVMNMFSWPAANRLRAACRPSAIGSGRSVQSTATSAALLASGHSASLVCLLTLARIPTVVEVIDEYRTVG
jgi:hypothetical protein